MHQMTNNRGQIVLKIILQFVQIWNIAFCFFESARVAWYIVNCSNSNPMKVSQIKTQHTLLTLNNKKESQEIQREIQTRHNSSITQISIYNSKVENCTFSQLPHNVQILVLRRCFTQAAQGMSINGAHLRVVELPYCELATMPIIKSPFLHKLNVSHNKIEEILVVPCSKTLKILDIRNNRIAQFTEQLLTMKQLCVLHQFIPQKLQKQIENSLENRNNGILQMSSLIGCVIYSWNNQKIIEVCEEIIDNNNECLLHQIMPFLNQEFITKIFEIAKTKRKHNILELLIKLQQCDFELDLKDRLMLLMPQLLPLKQLRLVTLEMLIKTLSESSTQGSRVRSFLLYVQQIQGSDNLFIQSEKDIINFMNLNGKYSNHFQIEVLLSQINFFRSYDFSNSAIIKYLLSYDNSKLSNFLLSLEIFKERIFSLGLYRQLVKPNKKIYKIIQKMDKQYQKNLVCRNNWYYPEYRQRQSFCLKNDVYDYQILRQYEEMQGSYIKKDFKYTFKFYNMGNQLSIAKRIDNEIKKDTFKSIKNQLNVTSTSTKPRPKTKSISLMNIST